jgi:hypothetical protein
MHSRGTKLVLRLRASFLRPLVLLSTLAGVACSSSPPSATQACTDLAKAQCAQIAQCDGVTMGVEWGNDQSQCAASLSASCVATNSFFGHGATPSSVEACASAVRGQSCANYGESLPACQTPSGTLANGAPCSIDAQCAGGACYTPNPAQQCGTCTQKSPQPSGGCSYSTECAAGEICAYPGQCIKPGGVGAVCPGTPCAPGLVCEGGDGGTSGTCAPLPGKGQPCVGGGFTSAGCASGLVCENQVCAAPTWVPLGGACPAASLPGASSGQLCAGGACIGGTCVAYATAGSPCSGFDSPPCAAGLLCTNRVCTQVGTSVSCGLVGDAG